MSLLPPSDVILFEEDSALRQALAEHMMGWPDILRLREAGSWPECQMMLRKHAPDTLVICRTPRQEQEMALAKEMTFYPGIRLVAYRREGQEKEDFMPLPKVQELSASVSLPLSAPFLHALRRVFRPMVAQPVELPEIKSFKKDPVKERRSFLLPPLPPQAIAIGVSTGGPPALQILAQRLAGHPLNVPVFITQHMPVGFTESLATHISKTIGQECREGVTGEKIMPDRLYLAPGGLHMEVVSKLSEKRIMLSDAPEENFCRPAVDVMLRSLSAAYGKRLLIVMLTGMGHDGLAGCKIAHENGATVIAQDEKTSTVWGMPRVVAEAGLCTMVLPLEWIGDYLLAACGVNG